MYFLIPFDTVFPIGSMLYILIISAASGLCALVVGRYIKQDMGISRIFALSLASYAIPLIFLSTIMERIPYGMLITYASPLVAWIAAGSVLFGQKPVRSAVMAAPGYAIFLFMAAIQLQLLIAMLLPF